MSKILILDRELYITYSWSPNNHGICGHTYEVIEYYYILKDKFDVCILLCEDITPKTFRRAIEDKYNFDENEVNEILANTRFENRPSLLKGKSILFTDGGVRSTSRLTLLFDNIIHLACGDFEVQSNNKDNVYILQDDRVYAPVLKNGINYKKKILFNRFKYVEHSADKLLVYVTKNCRSINLNIYQELADYFIDDFIVLASDPIILPDNLKHRFEFLEMPVNDLFTKFNSYVYTPIERKFDCSPRFIAECEFYGKSVFFHKIDYLELDLGLKWRKHDIKNDFESIYLTLDDDIISIINTIVKD